MSEPTTGVLHYGDNLDILRKGAIPEGSVDLVYLDPPFNSDRAYNVIFRDESGRRSDAQIEAFDDTWHWGPSAEAHYAYLTNTSQHGGRVPDELSGLIGALRKALGANQMTAYLVEMSVRLVELHRVLKSTGSLWLHCDPTASHYLKVALDAIFGADRFINEIVWQRTTAKSLMTRRLPNSHDVLLVFGKGPDVAWDEGGVFQAYEEDSLDAKTEGKYRTRDPDGRRYTLDNLTNPNHDRPNLRYEFLGVTKTWRWTRDRMEAAYEAGLVVVPSPGSVPRYKRYLDEQRGKPLTDVWTDIGPLNSQARERLGYPTQKPVALLERVLGIASRPGDVVLDPFCGCGTALVAAQTLGRRWIGIDVTYLSIAVMRARLRDSFPELGEVRVTGQPTEVEGARMLAQQSLDGRYEFQYWALSLVGALPSGQRKKGADSGIDGKVTFSDVGGVVREVLVEVKSGHVDVSQVRGLKGAMEREGAPLGLFLTLEEPTGPMLTEATTAGFWHSELAGRDYPRVQVLSIKELLDGKRPALPLLVLPTYQQATKVQGNPDQQSLDLAQG